MSELAVSAPDTAVTPGEKARDLDRSLAHGIAWTGGMKWLTQLVRWSSTLVVARLLTPSDYGLVGMAVLYLAFVQQLNEFGLSAAIVQRRGLEEDDLARLGGLSVLLGLFFFAVSAAASGLLAAFFGEPRLQPVLVVLSTTFVIRGVQVLPFALLTRELRFSRLAWIEAAEATSLALATLLLALLGYRYWSLVVSAVLSALVTALVSLRMRPHRLAIPRQLATLNRSLSFGGHVIMSRVAWYTYSNADFAIVGRVLGTAALGAYSFGWSLANIPVERVSVTAGRVTAAVFASVQDDMVAIRRYLLLLTEGIALLTFPATVGLALVADHFVAVVLGAKWAGAIVPLQILSLSAGLRSIDVLLPRILLATGRSKLTMWFSLIAAAVLPVLFYVGSRWGTTGVAVAWIVGFPLVVLPTNFRYTFRLLDLAPRLYLRALWPAVSSSLLMATAVVAARLALPADATLPLRLSVEVAAGVLAYGSLLWFAHGRRIRAFVEFLRATR